MENLERYEGTRAALRVYWPWFALLYGSVIAALILIGLGLVLQWYAFIPFSLAIMLVATYFLGANLWAVHALYDQEDVRPIDHLYRLSRTRPGSRVAFIDLGTRSGAIFVARHLTTGVVYDIDIYNPEVNASTTLRRRRRYAPKPPQDPRLRWLDGTPALLPLPDGSVDSAFLDHILSEYLLAEDRLELLREVRRILTADGHLVVAERLRSQTNLLVLGPAYFSLPGRQSLERELHQAGFDIIQTKELHGLVWCFQVNKPNPSRARQLALNLEYS